jgi:hypothetical protein
MFQPLGRGLRDTLDNLLPFTVASLLWWVSALLLVTAPAATLALFRFTDPRRLSDHLRLTGEEALAIVRHELVRAWGIALAIGIPVLVLVNNIRVYRVGSLRWFVPFWILLVVLVIAAGGIACSLRAVHGRSVGAALRRSVLLTLARAPVLLPVVLVLWVIVALGGVLVVPALMFVPALVAVTFNHLVYAALGIAVDDPLDPTVERQAEDQQARGGKYSVG